MVPGQGHLRREQRRGMAPLPPRHGTQRGTDQTASEDQRGAADDVNIIPPGNVPASPAMTNVTTLGDVLLQADNEQLFSPRALQRRRERHPPLRHRPVLLRLTPPGAVPIAHPVGAPEVLLGCRRQDGDGFVLDASAEEIHARRLVLTPFAEARVATATAARGIERAITRAARGSTSPPRGAWFGWLFGSSSDASGEEDPARVTRAPRADVAAEERSPSRRRRLGRRGLGFEALRAALTEPDTRQAPTGTENQKSPNVGVKLSLPVAPLRGRRARGVERRGEGLGADEVDHRVGARGARRRRGDDRARGGGARTPSPGRGVFPHRPGITVPKVSAPGFGYRRPASTRSVTRSICALGFLVPGLLANASRQGERGVRPVRPGDPRGAHRVASLRRRRGSHHRRHRLRRGDGGVLHRQHRSESSGAVAALAASSGGAAEFNSASFGSSIVPGMNAKMMDSMYVAYGQAVEKHLPSAIDWAASHVERTFPGANATALGVHAAHIRADDDGRRHHVSKRRRSRRLRRVGDDRQGSRGQARLGRFRRGVFHSPILRRRRLWLLTVLARRSRRFGCRFASHRSRDG